jgi:hypothetical protein
VREDRDVAGVNGCAGRGEQIGGRALRAEHVRLEPRVEVRDQLRQRRRRAAELRPVVDVEDRDPVAHRRDSPVDGLDPARVLARVEVLLGVRARGAPEPFAAAHVAEKLLDRIGERVDAEVVDEHAGLAGHHDAAPGARARRDHGDAARRGLDHGASQLRAT